MDIELLAPGGSYESVIAAFNAGADAVYTGGEMFGARANADNLTTEQLIDAINYAHIHNRKLYLTVNTLLRDDEINEKLYNYILPLYENGLDAVIVQDMGVFNYIRTHFPDLHIHASTQMTIFGKRTAQELKELGATRAVLPRELSLKEIKDIHENVNIEIECFVHGALCYCYSGQCFFSSYIGGRSGNRGRCAQPCRMEYDVIQNKKLLNPGDSKYVLSPKDICTLNILPDIIESGVHSLKIEGRMKSLHYIATVVSTYRKLIDTYCDDPENFDKNGYRKEIEKAANRALCTGFFKDVPNSDYQLYNQRDEHPTQDFCARVLSYDVDKHEVMIEQRNYFKLGDQIEFFSPHHENVLIEVKEIYNEDRESVEVANHPMEILYLKCEQPLSEFDMGRKVLTNEK